MGLEGGGGGRGEGGTLGGWAPGWCWLWDAGSSSGDASSAADTPKSARGEGTAPLAQIRLFACPISHLASGAQCRVCLTLTFAILHTGWDVGDKTGSGG